jgi:hypothetical protein
MYGSSPKPSPKPTGTADSVARQLAEAKMKKAGKPVSSKTVKYGFDGMQGQPKNPKLQGD